MAVINDIVSHITSLMRLTIIEGQPANIPDLGIKDVLVIDRLPDQLWPEALDDLLWGPNVLQAARRR